jgi:hypothetical protein
LRRKIIAVDERGKDILKIKQYLIEKKYSILKPKIIKNNR